METFVQNGFIMTCHIICMVRYPIRLIKFDHDSFDLKKNNTQNLCSDHMLRKCYRYHFCNEEVISMTLNSDWVSKAVAKCYRKFIIT